jgi:hypothetical protein
MPNTLSLCLISVAHCNNILRPQKKSHEWSGWQESKMMYSETSIHRFRRESEKGTMDPGKQ